MPLRRHGTNEHENRADDFLAQVDFASAAGGGRQRSFGFSAAAELAVFALAKTAHTSSPSRYCPPVADIGIPENPKAALAKIVIRCENSQPDYLPLSRCDLSHPGLECTH